MSDNIECFADCEYKKLVGGGDCTCSSCRTRGWCVLDSIVLGAFHECSNYVSVKRVVGEAKKLSDWVDREVLMDIETCLRKGALRKTVLLKRELLAGSDLDKKKQNFIDSGWVKVGLATYIRDGDIKDKA